MSQLTVLMSSLGRLSRGKLIASAMIALIIGGLFFASFSVLNKPVRQTLYSGLDAEDVNRIGSVLSEVGISFDVNEAGTAVLVEHGKTAQARMILASKGLPKSDKAGYELFDQMGSLGLTSFMQHVTRVRALEGELVRTIQQIEGIKSARVHLALKSEGTFRNRDEKPSASVVVRATGIPDEAAASAIRQIVAAAIPGLTADQVVVSTTDGRVLATQGGSGGAEPSSMFELEEKIAREAQERIAQTLAPVTGLENLRVSVVAKLDMDKRQTKETSFDPESKVERSSRVVKTSDLANGGSGSREVSAEQNVPQEVGSGGAGDNSSKKKESKEELVNYEVASKQTETVSNGYRVQRLSVAVVLNKKIFATAGGPAPDEKVLQAKLAEFEELVKSAAGTDAARSDSVKVAIVDFAEGDLGSDLAEGEGFMDTLKGNLGTIINSIAMLVAIILIIVMGLRPTVKMLVGRQGQEDSLTDSSQKQIAQDASSGDLSLPVSLPGEMGADSATAVPIDKLNRIVGIDTDRAAQVLRRWLEQPVKEAA